VVLKAVADINYRCVYVDIGSYGKDCDSTEQKDPNVQCFFVGEEGFVLIIYFDHLVDLIWVLKNECKTIICAKQEGTLNVLLEFWALNGEFSIDGLTSVQIFIRHC